MNLKRVVLRQFGRPSGNLGKLVGRIMSSSNRPLNQWTIEKLNARKDDCILEIGYGTGDTFVQLAKYLENGFIAGIDHSELMYKQAGTKCKKVLQKNKAELHHGTAWDIDYARESFDIAFAANVHFFWTNPKKEFSNIHDLLKKDGRAVIVFQPRLIKSDEELYKAANETKQQMREAGFSNIQVDFKDMKPVMAVCVSGMKKEPFI